MKKFLVMVEILLVMLRCVKSYKLESHSTEPKFLDIKTSQNIKNVLNEIAGKFSWIYNATVPHGYEINENSYNVPVYDVAASGKPIFTKYTKDYLLDNEKDEVKNVENPMMSLFEKFERFKNNTDLLFMTKVLLKIIVFKKIIKFIALVCLLFFLPTINDDSKSDDDSSSRKLKNFTNSTIWDNLDYRTREILYFTMVAVDSASVDKMVWCVAEHDAFCRFEFMMDSIDQIYTVDTIIQQWYPQTRPRMLKILDSIRHAKDKILEKLRNRFHVTGLEFHSEVADDDVNDDEKQEQEDDHLSAESEAANNDEEENEMENSSPQHEIEDGSRRYSDSNSDLDE